MLSELCYGSFAMHIDISFRNGDKKTIEYFVDIKPNGSINASQMESHLFTKFDSEWEKKLLKCGGKAIEQIKKNLATNEEFVVEKIVDKMERNEGVSGISLKYMNGKLISH